MELFLLLYFQLWGQWEFLLWLEDFQVLEECLEWEWGLLSQECTLEWTDQQWLEEVRFSQEQLAFHQWSTHLLIIYKTSLWNKKKRTKDLKISSKTSMQMMETLMQSQNELAMTLKILKTNFCQMGEALEALLAQMHSQTTLGLSKTMWDQKILKLKNEQWYRCSIKTMIIWEY